MGQGQHHRKLTASSYRLLRLGQRFLPPVLRGLLGLLLMILGLFGFLPVLGFWMIPLGLALLATDLPPLRRWFIRHLNQRRRKQRR